jgi:hypothetical protein
VSDDPCFLIDVLNVYVIITRYFPTQSWTVNAWWVIMVCYLADLGAIPRKKLLLEKGS